MRRTLILLTAIPFIAIAAYAAISSESRQVCDQAQEWCNEDNSISVPENTPTQDCTKDLDLIVCVSVDETLVTPSSEHLAVRTTVKNLSTETKFDAWYEPSCDVCTDLFETLFEYPPGETIETVRRIPVRYFEHGPEQVYPSFDGERFHEQFLGRLSLTIYYDANAD